MTPYVACPDCGREHLAYPVDSEGLRDALSHADEVSATFSARDRAWRVYVNAAVSRAADYLDGVCGVCAVDRASRRSPLSSEPVRGEVVA